MAEKKKSEDREPEVKAEKVEDKGYIGVVPDETPNENYTLAGVIAGKPTPETQRGK